eukprot:scaffold142_cov155-Amphora_coffeaeformis.AAC.2
MIFVSSAMATSEVPVGEWQLCSRMTARATERHNSFGRILSSGNRWTLRYLRRNELVKQPALVALKSTLFNRHDFRAPPAHRGRAMNIF